MTLDALKGLLRHEAGIEVPPFRTEGGMVIASKICSVTGQQYSVRLSLAAYGAWRNGACLQSVADELSAEEREFLISYNTLAEWDRDFGEEDQ